ncbi:hypothetical protein V6Z12_D11G359400 [Gossypium hirsutum]
MLQNIWWFIDAFGRVVVQACQLPDILHLKIYYSTLHGAY